MPSASTTAGRFAGKKPRLPRMAFPPYLRTPREQEIAAHLAMRKVAAEVAGWY